MPSFKPSPNVTVGPTIASGSTHQFTGSVQVLGSLLLNGSAVGSGGGDVTGPGSAINNALVRFDGTGGKTVESSQVTLDDSNYLLAQRISGTDITGSKFTVGAEGEEMQIEQVPGANQIQSYSRHLILENEAADKDVRIYLGSDDSNTSFGVRNASNASRLAVDGAGTIVIGPTGVTQIVNAAYTSSTGIKADALLIDTSASVGARLTANTVSVTTDFTAGNTASFGPFQGPPAGPFHITSSVLNTEITFGTWLGDASPTIILRSSQSAEDGAMMFLEENGGTNATTGDAGCTPSYFILRGTTDGSTLALGETTGEFVVTAYDSGGNFIMDNEGGASGLQCNIRGLVSEQGSMDTQIMAVTSGSSLSYLRAGYEAEITEVPAGIRMMASGPFTGSGGAHFNSDYPIGVNVNGITGQIHSSDIMTLSGNVRINNSTAGAARLGMGLNNSNGNGHFITHDVDGSFNIFSGSIGDGGNLCFRISGSGLPLGGGAGGVGNSTKIGINGLWSGDEPTEVLDVNGNARFRSISAGSSAGALHRTSTGVLTTNTSDERLKTNIETLENALDKVKALRPVGFNWKDEPDGVRRLGGLAQEVETVLPDLVFVNETTEDLYKGVHGDQLVWLLTRALQEQQTVIDELLARVEQLENS